MNFRKSLLIVTIFIVVIFLIGIASSYAWYTVSGGSTDFKTVATDADLNIIYAQSQIVNTTTSLPIKDSQKETLADSNIFTVSSPKDLEGYQVTLSISLINIKIDNDLKTKDFKYELLQDNVVIASGTGLDFDSNVKTLKDNISIDTTKTYTYTLRIWLSESGENQNNLMNKSFSAKIGVDSIAKK